MDVQFDQMVERLSMPSHSLEAEQSVIGSLLNDNIAYDKIAGTLAKEYFYKKEHQIIWDHMVKLFELGRPVDVVILAEALELDGKLEECGGHSYLNRLSITVPSSAHIVRYANIVYERYLLRRLVSACAEIKEEALNPAGQDVGLILDRAEAKIMKITERSAKEEFLSAKDIVRQLTQELQRLQSAGGEHGDVTGVSTGFVDLDRMTTGLHGGQLIIVAGRPGSGKTSFAMNIAEHVAVHDALPVAIFSMEMGGDQLFNRIISSMGRLDQQKLRRGQLNPEELSRFIEVSKQLAQSPLFVDETPGLNPIELRARCRRLHRKVGQLSLVVVDYLQLMSSTGGRANESRVNEVSEISRALKSLARELNCPVIALSQLNRNVEQRQDKRPMMSDLRESGAIEQDADVILFIHRDKRSDESPNERDTADLIIGKQRSGPTGDVKLSFDGKYTRFDNAAWQSKSGNGFTNI